MSCGYKNNSQNFYDSFNRENYPNNKKSGEYGRTKAFSRNGSRSVTDTEMQSKWCPKCTKEEYNNVNIYFPRTSYDIDMIKKWCPKCTKEEYRQTPRSVKRR